jgi:hypothetical protein
MGKGGLLFECLLNDVLELLECDIVRRSRAAVHVAGEDPGKALNCPGLGRLLGGIRLLGGAEATSE